MKPRRPRIAVVGSLNVDFTFRVPHLPKQGETLTAAGMEVHLGGKGANQAIAAARSGAEVSMIGCVGRDEHGANHRMHLAKEGIRTDWLFASEALTGSAFIAVDDRGENLIIVNSGANACLSIEHLNECEDLFHNIDAVLLQLECPLPVAGHAAKLAKKSGALVMVNPSPFIPAAVEVLKESDFWIFNESEFRCLNESNDSSLGPDGVRVLDILGCRALLVTHGAGPTEFITRNERGSISPPKVCPVDTVGAGDTFAGAFAVAVCESSPLDACIRFANAAGALATLKPGAQNSIPDRRLIEKMLQEQPTPLCTLMQSSLLP